MANIEKFCEKYSLGKVIDTKKVSGGFMHKMFKVTTNRGIYCIKVLNPEVMARKNAYSNLAVSESISHLAKKNGISVSSALNIDGNYLTQVDDKYYMVFDFINGKTLEDEEITLEHCKKIGRILASIHFLNYQEIGLKPTIIKYKRLYDWEGYRKNSNFSKMPYKDTFLANYRKYNSILKRANERFNESNINQAVCHLDMDPKNVMWNNNNPIIIDWECAGVANPERELLEDVLCWSGFLSNHFNEEKFIAVFKEYSKFRDIASIEWYSVICGNLVGRFDWLKYNLERSLGIVSNDSEETKLAEQEVMKTIDEINRYLELIGKMYDSIQRLIVPETKKYDLIIKKIIDNNNLLKRKSYNLITTGFTNTIYEVENYIVRICTDLNNEDRFKNEIEFYHKNKDNDKVPNLYVSDISKKIVPYYYEIMEKVNGKTLYEVWYKLSKEERKKVILNIIDILKTFHSIPVKEYDFSTYIKTKISELLNKCNISDELFDSLLVMCDTYFKENKFGIIHGDLHFDNFMYDDGRINLLDFERYMASPIDYDFRIFYRYAETPWLWASEKTDMLTVETDYQDIMKNFIENYDELRNIPYLEERLEVYSIIDLLEHDKDTTQLEKVIGKIKKLEEKTRS